MDFPEQAVAYVFAAEKQHPEDVDIIAHAGLHHYQGFDVSKIFHEMFIASITTMDGLRWES